MTILLAAGALFFIATIITLWEMRSEKSRSKNYYQIIQSEMKERIKTNDTKTKNR